MTKEIQAKDAEMQGGGRSNFDETRNLAKKGLKLSNSRCFELLRFAFVTNLQNIFLIFHFVDFMDYHSHSFNQFIEFATSTSMTPTKIPFELKSKMSVRFVLI